MASDIHVDPVLASDGDSDDELELYQEEEKEMDDSDSDPTFGPVDETEKALSKLSIKKSKQRIAEKQEHEEGDSKSFEAVEKLIKDGNVNKLKIDHCKVYLKQHGLRLTGKKDILLSRIKEHLELKDGYGETKYPVASFNLNCQGDACLGDVVMFEQKVYEMFNIASRSATRPPIGTRTVAGRIVNESYGESKQQHTFTIEVLWSKGEKPWPSLYQLRIKGRNLYKLKTMRQKWDNEEDRKKILQEKHERGKLARLSREKRIQGKEMRKTQKVNRKMKQSHGTLSTKPIPNFQDVTNLTNHQKPQENFTPETHAQIQSNHTPPTIPNLEFVLFGGSHQRALDQSRSVQSEAQMRCNHTPPTVPNLEFVLFSRSHQRELDQPRNVQREAQMRRNRGLVYPNSGHTVQAVGRNMSVSEPQHQWSNGHNRQIPQQDSYHRWGPQRQVHHRYDVHSLAHGRRNAPPVPGQLCRYHMQGRCRFGHDCKFRHE